MRKSYLAERHQYTELPEEKRKELVTQGFIFICAGEHLDSPENGYVYHFNQELPVDEQDEIFRSLI